MTNKLDNLKVKIAALLKKTEANGATEAEALEAISLARRLMRVHGVTIEDILKSTDASRDFTAKAVHSFRKENHVVDILGIGIATYTETRASISYSNGKKTLKFFGYSVDVDLAEYIYNICFTAIKTEWDRYKNRLPVGQRASLRIAFQIGMALNLRNRMNELIESEELSTGTDLIVMKNQLVTQAYEDATANVQKKKPRTDIVPEDLDFKTMLAGYIAGENVRFNREVESD